MENLPFHYANALVYDRQESIRQDIEHARIRSAAFSHKMRQLINTIEFLFKDATRHLFKGHKANKATHVSHKLAKE